MIRKQTLKDIDSICDIWLRTNVLAHAFIDAQYWHSMLPEVRSMLQEAEIYVYEEDDTILGFIGMDGSYIAGIFVTTPSRGIGTKLLNHVKADHKSLHLSVYQANEAAISFYHHQDFIITDQKIDSQTSMPEYTMQWSQK